MTITTKLVVVKGCAPTYRILATFSLAAFALGIAATIGAGWVW